MICPSCKKENKAGAKFCKHCGSALEQKFKTCKNGHNYDSFLSACPYCPQIKVSTNSKTSTNNQKTVVDKQVNIPTAPDISDQKEATVFPVSPKTSTLKREPEKKTTKKESPKEQPSTVKLIGWLVSYDINPSGTDYKLHEGKTKIGSDDYCNIVVKDASISDEHALLFYRDKKFVLQDELSTNGTFVNGKRIEERTILKDGDKMKFGNISFIIKII